MIDLVVMIPQAHERGHGDHQLAAGLEHLEHVQNGLPVVLNVFDDIKCRNQVIAATGVDHAAERLGVDQRAVRIRGVQQRLVNLDAADGTEASERSERQAVAAADVQNLRVAGRGQP